MKKKRVLAGMRPTNFLHIGNYFGAAKGMVSLQENTGYEAFYMVADLHSINTPYDPKEFEKKVMNVVLDYMACGLDPSKSTIFIQSHVREHIELSYLFSTVLTVARMLHLPTYKDKLKENPKNANMAMLYYPVLMASDILIYKANLVPVGIDQEPHIEISREIARKMNSKYKTNFPEPERFTIEGGESIPSLLGEGKMSKSVAGSFISLTDNLENIKEKLAKAPTDSGKGKKVPEEGGVASLLTLVELFEGFEKREKYEEMYRASGIKYQVLKEELAGAIYNELEPIQKKRSELEKKPGYIEEILEDGAKKARNIASETLKEVKEKMGLL